MRAQLIVVAALMCLAAPAALAAHTVETLVDIAAFTAAAGSTGGDDQEPAPVSVLVDTAHAAAASSADDQQPQRLTTTRKLMQNSTKDALAIIQGGGPKGGYVYCATGAKLPTLCTGVTEKSKATKFEVLFRKNGTRTFYRFRLYKSNNCLTLLTNTGRTVVSVYLYTCFPATNTPWYQLWGYYKFSNKPGYTTLRSSPSINDYAFYWVGAGKGIEARPKCDPDKTPACRYNVISL